MMHGIDRGDAADAAMDVLRFTAPTGAAGRQQLRALLRTHMAHESARTLRRFLVHLLAGLGGVLVACLLLPGIIPVELERPLVGIWTCCLLSVGVAAGFEWRLARAARRLLTEEDGR
ncbi:MAG TPA: hypothetical protein VGK30_19190 [Candidatus Binatia bacterium]|jgi:hypothetical protein